MILIWVWLVVVDLDAIGDISVLRQVAKLQQTELVRMHQALSRLSKRLNALEGGADATQRELFRLQEQLHQRTEALFGDSSEKRRDGDADSEPIASTSTETPSNPPARTRGPRNRSQLPVNPVLFALDEADGQCPDCGGKLREMSGQFEESEEVDVVERHFVVNRIQRQKYRCACCAHIETALGPTKLRPGNQ